MASSSNHYIPLFFPSQVLSRPRFSSRHRRLSRLGHRPLRGTDKVPDERHLLLRQGNDVRRSRRGNDREQDLHLPVGRDLDSDRKRTSESVIILVSICNTVVVFPASSLRMDLLLRPSRSLTPQPRQQLHRRVGRSHRTHRHLRMRPVAKVHPRIRLCRLRPRVSHGQHVGQRAQPYAGVRTSGA